MQFPHEQILARPPRIPQTSYKVRSSNLQKGGPRGADGNAGGCEVSNYALRNRNPYYIYYILCSIIYIIYYIVSSRLNNNSLSFLCNIYRLIINDARAGHLVARAWVRATQSP